MSLNILLPAFGINGTVLKFQGPGQIVGAVEEEKFHSWDTVNFQVLYMIKMSRSLHFVYFSPTEHTGSAILTCAGVDRLHCIQHKLGAAATAWCAAPGQAEASLVTQQQQSQWFYLDQAKQLGNKSWIYLLLPICLPSAHFPFTFFPSPTRSQYWLGSTSVVHPFPSSHSGARS